MSKYWAKVLPSLEERMRNLEPSNPKIANSYWSRTRSGRNEMIAD
jgi:hypothetical protein